MTVLGPLGPMWVIEVLIIIGGLGVAAALVARAKGCAFLPWLCYGIGLPIVALPHALLLSPAKTPSRRTGLLDRWLALHPEAAWTVVVAALVNVIFLDFHRELFGAAWQYVMWEGGVIECLTPINFLIGAFVFVLAALQAGDDRARRWWLVLYAFADVFLAGEEISWATGQIVLNLDAPDFESKYNRPTTLHHFLPGVGPIIIFFVIVLIFRVFYPRIRARLGAPMAIGFLNAVLLTLLVAPFMRYDHPHFLFFDEVYEWSGSVLLLHLALYERWRWSFTR